jgi:hypothetical protein
MLFDWLVTGQVLEVNPAHAVRGPKYIVKKGKTPVLNLDEARARSTASRSSLKPPMRTGQVRESARLIERKPLITRFAWPPELYRKVQA